MAAVTEKDLEPPRELTEPPAPLPFERRSSRRHAAIGTLEAVQCDGLAAPIVVQLKLCDEGPGGLAARINTPMSPGARLRVRTCPATGVWRDGVILRCLPNGDGYRIALAYERRRAA